MKKFLLLPLTALGLAVSHSHAARIDFIGADAGAASFAAMVNSQAAAASFNSAAGSLSVIDFESPLPAGVSIAGGSTINTTSGFALFGDNTTVGGDFYRSLNGGTMTFSFVTPIDSFGAYLTGLQGDIVGQQTVTYANGNVVNIPLLSGGGAFVGFIDAGASITSVSIAFNGDIIGVDDVRYGNANSRVPDSGSTIALLGLALAGLVAIRRRK
jgi:hypothetical protein